MADDFDHWVLLKSKAVSPPALLADDLVLEFVFNFKSISPLGYAKLMRGTFLCLATKKYPKNRAFTPLGCSGFKPIEVEFAQHLRLSFPAGWVPSAEFSGSDTELHGPLGRTGGSFRV